MRKTFTHFVMGATALTSIVSSMAGAAVTFPNGYPDPQDPTIATLGAMQAQCLVLAGIHGPNWSASVDEDSIVAQGPTAGPTESGPRTVDVSTIVGVGDFIPESVYIDGEPFRIGGSVNMFGDQYSEAGHYPHSAYDFDALFTTTYDFAFDCTLTETVPGHHVWTLDPSDPNAGACRAYDANGLFQGEDQGQCVWVGETSHESGNEAGVPVSQSQTDTLTAHEDFGGPTGAEGGPIFIGQVVVCISPSTTSKKGVPGDWVKKNGYDGIHCTTDWFKNFAEWGSGSQTSNGTWISVPDYHLY